MNDDAILVILRILNRSETIVVFQTTQGVEIVVTPGSIIDIYSFEVDESPSFQKISQSESLKVEINQSSSINKIYLEKIKSEIKSFREPYSTITKESKAHSDKHEKVIVNPIKKTRKKKAIPNKSKTEKEVNQRIVKSKSK